jgi:hypothetical protein
MSALKWARRVNGKKAGRIMKSLYHNTLFKTLAVGLALGSPLAGARALECPKPQPLGGAAGAAASLEQQLASKDVLAQIPGILGSLHQQFPKADKQQLTDYLISAYCPVINGAANLNEQEKQAHVREFANSVIAAEY